jgi:hypothetical protein
MDVEEFRAAIRELHAQARRAYDEQLEVMRLMQERELLRREALPPKVNGGDHSNLSVSRGGDINRGPDAEPR